MLSRFMPSKRQQFTIWIVTPDNYVFSRCFEEVALSMQAALAKMGYNAPIVKHPGKVRGCAIVLGPNVLFFANQELPKEMILYNLEQVSPESPWFYQYPYVDYLRQYPVWDYSRQNIEKLKEFGVNAAYCGIGYMPELTKIPDAAEKDIDVLFFGGANERRLAVINELNARGYRALLETNAYGEQRDALVARSKIILNIHAYNAYVFEIVRVSYMLANRKCVVSETGNDEELEGPFRAGIAFTPYEGLVDTCIRLLNDDAERARLEQKGFEIMSQISQLPMMQDALKAVKRI